MKRIAVLLFAVVVVAAPLAAYAANQADGQISKFNRELVNRAKKSVVGIWIMEAPDGFPRPVGIGSGFIFQGIPEENAAYALTNNHVGFNTVMLQCETWDRHTYKAQAIALEPGIDIALIKVFDIPPDAYEVAVLGDSDSLTIGEPALAMGAPGSGESLNTDRSDPWKTFGLHGTATLRVVTGIETNPFDMVEWWPGFQGEYGYESLCNLPYRIVTQSGINGGNSGGPLFNARGEVIGLNHAHSQFGNTSQNQNFTIPINPAKNFAFQILDTGKYELPWLGLDMLVPPEMMSLMGNSSYLGGGISEFYEKYYNEKVLKVFNVRKDSPADRAGFKAQDVMLEFDGQAFPTVTDLRLYIFQLPIGKEVPVVVKRGREKVKLTVEVGVKRHYNSEFSF